MSEPLQGLSHTESSRAAVGPANFILSWLASLKFALVVVLLIALACITGTLIPQGSEGAAYLTRHPDARRVMDVLSWLGLTRLFYSWWFVGLLFVFAACLSACTVKRYTMIRRTSGAARLRVIGSFITHVSLILVLTGGVVRVLWGQKGMIQLHEGETAHQAESPGGPIVLPFSIRLVHFEVEFYNQRVPPSGPQTDQLMVQWAEKNLEAEFPVELQAVHPIVPPDAPANAEPAFKVSVIRYVPDFSIDGSNGEVNSRSEEPNNPAVLVSVTGGGKTNTQWVFARFPDFNKHDGADGAAAPMPLKFRFNSAADATDAGREPGPIKAFRSKLEVLDGGKVLRTSTIAVNSPLAYRGYTFYQSSYDPADLTWTALQIVRDPGVPIVYSGFVLMMAGLTMVFCVGPWLDSQRRTKGGMS